MALSVTGIQKIVSNTINTCNNCTKRTAFKFGWAYSTLIGWSKIETSGTLSADWSIITFWTWRNELITRIAFAVIHKIHVVASYTFNWISLQTYLASGLNAWFTLSCLQIIARSTLQASRGSAIYAFSKRVITTNAFVSNNG